MTVTPLPQADAADLAAAVLAGEAERQDAERARGAEVPAVSDDLLAGVGQEGMSLRAIGRAGGWSTLAVLASLVFVDALDGSAFGVLAPDIQRTLHLSDTAIGVIGALGGLVVFVAAIPLGSLGDRMRRTVVIAASTLIWSVFAGVTAIAQNTLQLVAGRIGAGFGKANEIPVQGSLLADAYPIQGRSRVFASIRIAQALGFLVGPLLAGGLAAAIGGGGAWRWVFVLFALPAIVLGLVTFRLREPQRGRNEMMAVLGEELPQDPDELPIPLSAGFARLKKIQTFHFLVLAVAVMGMAFVATPIYVGLLLHRQYGLGPTGRGVVGAVGAVGSMIGVAVAGTVGDRLFRRAPERAAVLVGVAVLVYGLLATVALYMPNAALFTVFNAIAGACAFGGFVLVQPIAAAVTPYRLRATGGAMVSLYLSLFGGLFGAILVGQLASVWGERTALAAVLPPVGLVGGSLFAWGARHVRDDMAMASADLLEERNERIRVAEGGEVAMLQVRGLDFSYGAVQVLFDVSIDVKEGEVLALLGTNGAGKSTLLRAISGLSYPDRGTIRLGGRTITFSEPGVRVNLGVVQVPGGKATFPSLSVQENLRAAGYPLRRDGRLLDERIDEVLELFPILRERLSQPAGTLSGGEQQMLAIAGALLLRPKILLIDELSLGLAPVVVQQLLDIVARLKATGLTMVIVEQSVNIALAIADRAVFMEKGQVKFEGPAEELRDRDDLVRAVFLGAGAQ
jgi:ABC-type branched-subunit amino acid transport system ATPase component/predicted MFS family arabinose efflux permease